jgi:hypothetical protein
LTADQNTPVGATARVEIDLFSGRPNPSFELDQPATHELIGLLSHLKRSDVKAARRDVLGFRGLAVTVEGRPQLFVSGSAVFADPEQFADEARTVERFLLSRIPEDLRRQFRDVLPP